MKANLQRHKKLSMLIATTLLIGTMTGCGSQGGAEETKSELNVYCWTEYMPQSVVDKFTEETGIKVNMSTYSSNEDMLAKVKAEEEGTFDIVFPSEYMVKQMAEQGLLMELDKSKLTNIGNIDEGFMDLEHDPGNKYSVPYLAGAGIIAKDKTKVNKDIKSYADLFDPELKNTMVVLDDFRAIIGMTNVSLGYDFNETDPSKLASTQEKILTFKDNVKLYDSDSPKSALISGDCIAAMCWSAEIAMAMQENPNIEVIYPEEGPYLFMDNMAVLKGAKHSEEAMQFINFILDAENMKRVLEEFPYLSPNKAAIEQMDEDYINNPAKNIPSDIIASGHYVKNLDTETLAVYDEMWTKLKQ